MNLFLSEYFCHSFVCFDKHHFNASHQNAIRIKLFYFYMHIQVQNYTKVT